MTQRILTLAQQSRYLFAAGIESTVSGGVLSAEFSMRPCEGAKVYTVAIQYQFPRRPLTLIVAPELMRLNGSLPHCFVPLETGKYAWLPNLCLFRDPWAPDQIFTRTLLPWCAEWLTFYELWAVTGEWLGGGMHVRPVKRRSPELTRIVR